MTPYATLEESTFFPAFFCKVTFLPLLAILVTRCDIISLSLVTGVMTEINPVVKELFSVGQKVYRSV